jgi:hypothetical protein
MAKTPVNKALVFKKEWIFDPGPEWMKLNRVDSAKVNRLKTDFVKNVNQVLKGGQQ